MASLQKLVILTLASLTQTILDREGATTNGDTLCVTVHHVFDWSKHRGMAAQLFLPAGVRGRGRAGRRCDLDPPAAKADCRAALAYRGSRASWNRRSLSVDCIERI